MLSGSWSLAPVNIWFGTYATSSSSLLQKKVVKKVNLIILWPTDKQQKNACHLVQPNGTLAGSMGHDKTGQTGATGQDWRLNTTPFLQDKLLYSVFLQLFSNFFWKLIITINTTWHLQRTRTFFSFIFHFIWPTLGKTDKFTPSLQRKKLRHEKM